MSMNKKTRSLINTKYESQRIYYQRREIKKKDQQITKLTNNWNELEECIRNKFLYYSDNTRELDEDTILYCLHKKDVYREVLDKMEEIKEGKND